MITNEIFGNIQVPKLQITNLINLTLTIQHFMMYKEFTIYYIERTISVVLSQQRKTHNSTTIIVFHLLYIDKL